MARTGDVRGLLCRRGVRFIIDWDIDLGRHITHDVRVFKPHLTGLKSPAIRVRDTDEIARIKDLRRFDPQQYGLSASIPHTIYAWRLSGC
ncbi:MAG: hypothetical protein AB7O43_15620 [Hyphomicrobiaceae bacterium]